jgi:tetratricopeptide (TPR) repeat protein
MATLRPVNGVTGDRNVGPYEVAAFAESQGLKARAILGASVDQLKALVAAGIAPIAETWYIPDPNDEMGHYQLLIGFDGDNLQFYDSYKGPNVNLKAADFDALWRVFNRTAIVAWRLEQEQTVRQIFGDLMDDRLMAERALATAQAEAQRNPQDKWAQFNIGSSLLRLGDSAGAAKAYDAARKLGLPWRTLWYQYGPYNAYYDVGRYDEVIAMANETLRPVNNLEESYYWRAQAYAAKGQNDAAQRDMATVRQLKPNFNAKLQAYP